MGRNPQYALAGNGITTLRNSIFSDAPKDLGIHLWLETDSPRVLLIHDRGTTGLGGPTRADADDEGEPRDFVDFLRNVGTPPDKALGGGTYGYGKAALYLNSVVHTICVHTRCLNGGRLESRFMAAGLGQPFDVKAGARRRRYTGRHWWGRIADDIAEPVTGREADALAAALGMPPFLGSERGTTIMVLAPELGERTPAQAMNVILWTLLWNFWPKMLAGPQAVPAIQFSARLDGVALPIPDPRRVPPISGFTVAMDAVKAGPNAAPRLLQRRESIVCERPRRLLGQLALQKFVKQPRIQVDCGPDVQWPIDAQAHHVALMRPAELVVRYLPGPPLSAPDAEYAGVFLADTGVDRLFARSEPPTHDDWVPDALTDRTERSLVRVALRRIGEVVRDYAAPPPITAGGGAAAPALGRFAGFMGALLPGTISPDAARRPFVSEPQPVAPERGSQPGERTSGAQVTADPDEGEELGRESEIRRRSRVQVIDEPVLDEIDGTSVLCWRFMVHHATGAASTLVRAEPATLLDGNAIETDPPAGAGRPRILRWVSPAGEEVRETNEILIPATRDGEWRLDVTIPDDVVVDVAFRSLTRNEP